MGNKCFRNPKNSESQIRRTRKVTERFLGKDLTDVLSAELSVDSMTAVIFVEYDPAERDTRLANKVVNG